MSKSRLNFNIFCVVLAGLVAALLFGVAHALVWPLHIDLGQGDARFVHGFHEPEQVGDTKFRWTTERSELRLPQIAPGPAIITMRVLNGYPEGQPDPVFTLSSNQHPIGSFTIGRTISGVRRYAIVAPIEQQANWAIQLTIESTTYTPPTDARQLGAAIDWIQIAQTNRTSNIAPWFLLLSAAIGTAAFALLALLLGASTRRAFVVAVAIVALFAILAYWLPLDILPFVQRLAAIPVIGCLALGLSYPLTNRSPRRIADASPQLLGIHLPLLLAIAWWALPLFQAVQLWDAAEIGVGNETFILAGIALLAVAFALGLGYLRTGNQPAAQRKNRLANYALGGAAVGAVIHLCYAIWYAFTRSGKDFWILFKGAREWARGGSLYDMEAVLTNHVGAVFKVPPFYGMLFTPFVFQDGLQILLFHRMLNVGLMLATAAIWLLMFRPKPIWWGIAAIAILLNSRPLADTIAYGQIDLMLLFLLTAALWAMRNDRDGLAGALIALGTLFKVYPIILLAFLVLKGRWRGVLGFMIGMLVCNGIAIGVMGWEMHRQYLFEVIPNIGGTTSWVENQTISGFMARFVDTPFEAHLFTNRTIALLATAISGLISLLACWLTLRPAEGRSTAFALQYCQFLLLMVLVVPAAWMHYQTLLILVFGVLLIHLRERELPLSQAALFALGFALISYGNQWSFGNTTVMGIISIAGASYKFYGMLLIGTILLYELLALPRIVSIPRMPWVGMIGNKATR